ncbi:MULTISPECIES: phosphoribosyl-AMP cyclohydrolase [Thermodesulfobacterium]|jgi:phosphoribosyl-AMP cyclohydrolase|uniref:Phosphoribosyl-AMP cyclohydrolase n=2 Tax=Thermodesulfobacterium commune TaxID=1741 RepID=A0A075WZA7_9BACT|nr:MULTISPECIES: phosphoribosyl-AMP cyclohydrolase [Thermodesulfobacterium]KUJ97376.1 MAG: Phosphoribosyl-AMP cyclohydrolase [Thermodesulfobacterium sp. 37_54]KUK19062.1 MAG: Phosphoribosyl-AMP cyclohydrolase [Thermodesulfobacterium commune]AIH04007.1 phosphoribosyl-AMP cyclohydrolase [Thermodesulfobacterium commune DSM 2178]KUK38244.1 MAG: Phosphoribosyl-AMP cyclohydrolase [Thermodesulfobacterium commune]MBZ4681384.1 phosphoribosyl-AMP cyclohydrolase [Thermodesulfobacterium sp.]
MELKLNFEKLGGLLPAVIQDFKTSKVLMVGFLNEEALRKTLETGLMHFYSRTRNKIWLKGETSKHYLVVKEVLVDCDEDTLLFKVEPKGPVCHEGYMSCFYRKLGEKNLEIIEEKMFNPEEVYGKKA